ncbi:DUF3108 domain-containing protein [Ramlibacter sp.]|uniref:DUF3108 domain-containing protein n=1 Tax=Ramlibacter sp. TaxID=1917967 RepID=UPI002B9C0BA5|nr:DUF3108 domain-containing protein [Ramlibacter sp.]HWI80593.1 DUF3108 domain-containing protein [Ramlibacter sp.]
MVGARRLSPRAGRRWLALLALVLAAHLAVLDWVGRQLQQTAALRPLATPMFTRVLQQEAARTPPPAATVAAEAAPSRPAVRTIAPPAVAAKATPAASAAAAQEPPPEPAEAAAPPIEPEPEVAAAPAAEPAAAAASAPVAPASEAVATAPASAASAAAGPPSLDGWPVDTRLNYRLGGRFRSGELHGGARVQWLRQDERYEVRIDIDITLLARLVLTSQGGVTPQGLKPDVYEELRRSGPRRATLREETILLGNGKVVPRPAGVQDTASQFVELSHRFASGQEPLEAGRSVSFWMARPGGVDLWTYDVVGRETLRTPRLGEVEAVHLKPRPIANPRGNITAEMWFAPTLHYLPVRIKVNLDENTFVDLIVESIEQR